MLQTGEYDFAWNLQVGDEVLMRLEKGGKGKAAGHKVKLTAALVLAGTSTEGLSKPGRWVGGQAGRQAHMLQL